MRKLMDDVAAFHRACDVPALYSPTPMPPDRAALRVRLIDEEVNGELIPAIRAGDMSKIAHESADAIYVIVGTALEAGIPLDAVWEIVQHANMAKVDPDTGLVRRRQDGKILKPPGWIAPDARIAALVSP